MPTHKDKTKQKHGSRHTARVRSRLANLTKKKNELPLAIPVRSFNSLFPERVPEGRKYVISRHASKYYSSSRRSLK